MDDARADRTSGAAPHPRSTAGWCHAGLRARRRAAGIRHVDAADLVANVDPTIVQTRCQVARDVARERYRLRQRDPRHVDERRDEQGLRETPVGPLGVGPLLVVDTTGPTDVARLMSRVRQALKPGGVLPS